MLPATPSQQNVPDPSRSFKPIKTINKGNRGTFLLSQTVVSANRVWIDTNCQDDLGEWKYAVGC